MPLPQFPIVDEFYDWLRDLQTDQAIVASASVLAIASEGPYNMGCADLGDGIWCYTTPLYSPNLYMRIYVYSDGKKLFRYMVLSHKTPMSGIII
jgi:hypothetical protein